MTATEKWSDQWFRKLSPTLKLAFLYLCDNCDGAGIIELDRDLANFQIGTEVEWDDLLIAAGDRIETLASGRLWLTKFVAFQYGILSEACSPHKPVISSLQKHGLYERVLKGFQSPINRAQDKDKEKDKEKEGGSGGKPKSLGLVPIPDSLASSLAFRELWSKWLEHRCEIRHKATKKTQETALDYLASLGVARAVAALRHSIRNGWQGIFEPDSNARNREPQADFDPGFAITDEAQLLAREGRTR